MSLYIKIRLIDWLFGCSFFIAADVDGSLEAIESCLATYDCDLVTMETMASGVGVVTENDVELAKDFNGK